MARVVMPGVWDYIKFCSIYYTLTRGLTALCFCVSIAVFSMLLSAVRQCLTRVCGASPIALEDGTPCPPTPTTANTETDAEAPTRRRVRVRLLPRPLHLLLCLQRLRQRRRFARPPGLVRRVSRPYVRRRLKKEHSDAAVAEPEVASARPAAPVEVLLFDDGVVGEKDLLKVEEKAWRA
ncbi:hypothetical protein B0H14DRAFT_2890882, partial [Mycena olivaceomarginata]